jgi:hypothetical protein
MTDKDIQILIDKYLEGMTTPEEELSLARELQRQDMPEEWKAIRLMLGDLALGEAEYDAIITPPQPLPREEPTPNPSQKEGSIKSLTLRGRLGGGFHWGMLVAAACVAALVIVFLGPPKKVVPKEPQIAKVETGEKKEPLPKPLPREGSKKPTLNSSRREKPNPSRRVGRIKSLPPHGRLEGVSYGSEEPTEPVTENTTLRPVEEGDVIPFEDPMVQFAEQARALRERGNRVIQRVSMNSIPPDNYPLNDL